MQVRPHWSSSKTRFFNNIEGSFSKASVVKAKNLRGVIPTRVAKGVINGLENEHACNIASGRETARLLAAVDHPNLRDVWDPANALVAGEVPYPDGYNRLPFDRIAHVHAKDCRVRDRKVTFHAFGEGQVDWQGQIHALARDGYRGWISLETHWGGPGGNKLEGSRICGRSLLEMATAP